METDSKADMELTYSSDGKLHPFRELTTTHWSKWNTCQGLTLLLLSLIWSQKNHGERLSQQNSSQKCIGNGKIIMGNKTGRCFERNGGNSLCVLLWDEPQIQREEFDSLFWVLFKKEGLRGFESSKNVII